MDALDRRLVGLTVAELHHPTARIIIASGQAKTDARPEPSLQRNAWWGSNTPRIRRNSPPGARFAS